MAQQITTAEMNEHNKWFWSGVAARDRQIEDQGNIVMSSVDVTRLEQRVRFESEEKTRCKIWRDQATKAGRADKSNPLTKAIREMVRQQPDISEFQLRKKLHLWPDIEVLDATDHKTMNPLLAHSVRYRRRDGTYTTVRIETLKDRLYERKRKFSQSRITRIGRASLGSRNGREQLAEGARVCRQTRISPWFTAIVWN